MPFLGEELWEVEWVTENSGEGDPWDYHIKDFYDLNSAIAFAKLKSKTHAGVLLTRYECVAYEEGSDFGYWEVAEDSVYFTDGEEV